MKTLALAALLFITPAASAQEEAPAEQVITCADNAQDLYFVEKDYEILVARFKAATNPREKFVIAVQGNILNKMHEVLLQWRKLNCKDV